jgi:hypothetical protein
MGLGKTSQQGSGDPADRGHFHCSRLKKALAAVHKPARLVAANSRLDADQPSGERVDIAAKHVQTNLIVEDRRMHADVPAPMGMADERIAIRRIGSEALCPCF